MSKNVVHFLVFLRKLFFEFKIYFIIFQFKKKLIPIIIFIIWNFRYLVNTELFGIWCIQNLIIGIYETRNSFSVFINPLFREKYWVWDTQYWFRTLLFKIQNTQPYVRYTHNGPKLRRGPIRLWHVAHQSSGPIRSRHVSFSFSFKYWKLLKQAILFHFPFISNSLCVFLSVFGAHINCSSSSSSNLSLNPSSKCF